MSYNNAYASRTRFVRFAPGGLADCWLASGVASPAF